MNWFLPFLLAFSFSVRTPNIGDDLDHQFSFSAEKKGSMYMSVESEREDGQLFKNEEYWVKYGSDYIQIKDIFKDNQARNINYNELQTVGVYKGFKGGYALRHIREIPSHRLVMGYEYDKATAGIVRLTTRFDMSTNFSSIDYSAYTKFDFALMKFLTVFALGSYEECQGRDFWQLKTGISIEIPQIGE